MAVSLSITLEQGTQDIANNRTYVTAKVYATSTNGSYNNNSKSGYLILDGTNYSFSSSFAKNATTLLYSVSKWCSHDSVGAKTVSASASFVTGVSSGTITASASKVLSTIPRVSDIAVNKSSIPADGVTTITATATKKSSSFTDTITVKLGSYSKTVSSGVAFTISKEWLNAISGTSATATVTVTTKSGSTTIGSKSVTFTVTVPADVVPTISSISVSEAITSVTSAFGNRYVKTLSRLNIKVNAAGVYGSTIKTCAVTLDGVVYQQTEFQSNALNTAGNLEIKAVVTDSRGRTCTLTKTITVVDYAPPAIISMTQYPCNADGSRNANGANTKVIIKGKVSSVASQNSKALILKYKAMDAANYTVRTLAVSDWDFEVSTIISGTDPTSTWEYIAELSDKISDISYRIVSGVPVISRLAGGKGVRFFGEAESEGLWVGNIDYTITDEEFDELLKSLGGGVVLRLIDWFYPVGSVVASVNAAYDPNKLYSHQTWVRFAKGQTLVGVDEADTAFSTAEKTGGEKTHTLTVSEMPSHAHTRSYFTAWDGKASGGGYAFSSTNAGTNNQSTAATGGSGAHNNLQPYVTVYYWKRTA